MLHPSDFTTWDLMVYKVIHSFLFLEKSLCISQRTKYRKGHSKTGETAQIEGDTSADSSTEDTIISDRNGRMRGAPRT